MKDYSKVKFIKISDNKDAKIFYIDVSVMKDYRLRISALKGQYAKYLQTGELYRPVFDLLGKDYSFCCLEKGSFDSLNAVKKRRKEIIVEQNEKLKNVPSYEPSFIIKFME